MATRHGTTATLTPSETVDEEPCVGSSENMDGSDPKCSVDPLGPKLIDALSPTGGIYDLWTIIIEMAEEQQRRKCLCIINRHFATICRRIESEIVQDSYSKTYLVRLSNRFPDSHKLNLPKEGVEWAMWGANRLFFGSIDRFREFCELGDIDPSRDAARYDRWSRPPWPTNIENDMCWVFAPQSRDLFFETSMRNPILENEDGYVHYFGITGKAEKLRKMYQFVIEDKNIVWDELSWGRRYFI